MRATALFLAAQFASQKAHRREEMTLRAEEGDETVDELAEFYTSDFVAPI